MSQPTVTENGPDFHDFPNAWRESHQIHVSEMRSFQNCRRRWDWASREGFVLPTAPQPLEFGIAFHIGMEAGFDPDLWKTTNPQEKLELAINAFTEECERQRIQYLADTGQSRLLEADGDNYAERIDLGIGMLEYYWLRIHPKFDKWFRPVYTEIPFQVPIVDPTTGEPLRCAGISCGQNHPANAVVTFNGRIDAIVEDILNRGYWLLDHKSAKTLRIDDRILQLDPQVGGYMWAVSEALEINVKGFLYIEYRKDFPQPPAMLSRLYKGRSFSTNANQATEIEIFEPYIAEHDPIAYREGKYDEYIAFLKSKDAPKFHQRFPIRKTKKNLRNIGVTIFEIAREMVDPTIAITPHVGTFSCGNCAYYQPCLAKMLGEDYEHSLTTSFKKVKSPLSGPDSDGGSANPSDGS